MMLQLDTAVASDASDWRNAASSAGTSLSSVAACSFGVLAHALPANHAIDVNTLLCAQADLKSKPMEQSVLACHLPRICLQIASNMSVVVGILYMVGVNGT